MVRTKFLSPPSARRATGTDGRIGMYVEISIPALREEGDFRYSKKLVSSIQFLSPPSARRATPVHGDQKLGQDISIPALREEGDTSSKTTFWRAKNFYPRPPRGGRQIVKAKMTLTMEISIPALREEGDAILQEKRRIMQISIPALREEGDLRSAHLRTDKHHFYPRPPRGGRPSRFLNFGSLSVFLSPPSARRATDNGLIYFQEVTISIPALREEGD